MTTDQRDLHVVEGGDGIRGQRSRLGENGTDLDDGADTVDHGDQIDLTAGDGDVAPDDLRTGPREHSSGDPLAGPTYERPMGGSIGAPGSSSSMFTSRKVRTRTLVRNRAGRYMSHTHASSSSSSK